MSQSGARIKRSTVERREDYLYSVVSLFTLPPIIRPPAARLKKCGKKKKVPSIGSILTLSLFVGPRLCCFFILV